MTSIFQSLLLPVVAIGLLACGGASTPQTSDAGPSAQVADAAPAGDGAVVQCQADHQESLDSSNDRIVNVDNQVEPTGQTLSAQGGFSLCGQLDPQHETGVFADVDVYEFTVASDASVRVELTVDSEQELGAIELLLLGADGPTTISEAQVLGTFGLTHRVVPQGRYWVAVLAKAPLAGNAPLPYKIRIRPEGIACERGSAATSYQEAFDGQSNRENDTLEIDYDESASFAETTTQDDSPEMTSIVLAPDEGYAIIGTTADVEALDDYRDRDTYLIQTGPNTRELSLRGSWEHSAGVDLDIHLFLAGAPDVDLSFNGAAQVGVSNDEVTAMAVLPNRDYWLWVAAYDNDSPTLPLEYELTLCGAGL